VSAAAGLGLVKIFFWHGRLRVAPYDSPHRETGCARIMPSKCPYAVVYAVTVLTLSVFVQGLMLLVPSSIPKHMKFDKPLEHVVVQSPVNFVRREAGSTRDDSQALSSVQQLPCQQVLWEAEGSRLETNLTIERCFSSLPTAPYTRSALRALHKASVNKVENNTFNLWAIPPTDQFPTEDLWLFKGNEEPIVLSAHTAARVVGTNELRYVRWPDNATAQILQLVPFFERVFVDLGCKQLDVPDIADIEELGYQAVRLWWTCSNVSSAGDLFTPLAHVMLGHVDLRTADREGGFAASFTRAWNPNTKEAWLNRKRLTVGITNVPYVNIVGGEIAGAIAVIVFILVSRLPGDCKPEALPEHSDAIELTSEQREDHAVKVDVGSERNT
jgi:hypothetical protein